MQMIDPALFTRLMRLPDAARGDLLEFLGGTPVGPAELERMIDSHMLRPRREAPPEE